MNELERIQKIIAREKEAVIIEVRKNVVRVVAEIFDHPDGIVFVDIGFCDPMFSGHPFHLVEGELSGTGPWKVGTATIRIALPDEDLYLEWRGWRTAKKVHGCTRELAAAGVAKEFG